jgi:hypothetical protein
MRLLLMTLVSIACLLLADDAPQGVPARQSASEYAAKAQWQNATFAASLVPSKQVEHLFAFDISRSFVVFEVACYADGAAAVKISREAFVVKSKSGIDPVHRADPDTVASTIERQNQPSLPSATGLDVATAATIGVQHGTDPYTGRPVTNVYTGGQVTTETGRRDNAPPPRDPKPGATPEDRTMLAAQLRVRSIPEGPVNHPVAGYVYFRKSDIKAQADGTYDLQYLAEEDGTGLTHAVTLNVPVKPR